MIIIIVDNIGITINKLEKYSPVTGHLVFMVSPLNILLEVSDQKLTGFFKLSAAFLHSLKLPLTGRPNT